MVTKTYGLNSLAKYGYKSEKSDLGLSEIFEHVFALGLRVGSHDGRWRGFLLGRIGYLFKSQESDNCIFYVGMRGGFREGIPETLL
jgi:hypothetical protein